MEFSVADALAVLGLGADPAWRDIKQAYRSRIATAHPDRGGTNEFAARINEAYARLAGVYGAGPAELAQPAPDSGDEPAIVDDDSLAIVAPPDEVFARLVDAIDGIGAVTYVDANTSYLEAVIDAAPPSGACQLVVNLQGRGEATEAFFSLEALGAYPAPPLAGIVRDVAAAVRRAPRRAG